MNQSRFHYLLVILFLIVVGCSNNQEETNSSLDSVSTVDSSQIPSKENKGKVTSTRNYEIVYALSNKRFDKGINLYVLLEPSKAEDPTFIDDIKLIINELVEEHGKKTSIDFYDNREVLDLDYKLYGDLSLGRNTTSEENKELALHHIAGFSGDLTTDLYLNTLYLFPNADSDTPKVGEMVSIKEYNPIK